MTLCFRDECVHDLTGHHCRLCCLRVNCEGKLLMCLVYETSQKDAFKTFPDEGGYSYWAKVNECFWITSYWHWTDNRVFHKGTLLASMDQLNSLPNTTANFSLQVFSILPHRPSGPVTVDAFTLLNTSVTLSSSIFSNTSPSEANLPKSVLTQEISELKSGLSKRV